MTAIVVAGGMGMRMNAAIPKQFLMLRGKPVIQWSLESFAASRFVEDLVLVLPGKWLDEGQSLMKEFRPGKPFRFVSGGELRQDSVAAGLDVIGHSGWVAVHDGARPAISREVIDAAISEAHRLGNAVCAIPASDTLVEASDGVVTGDVPRQKIFYIQTPQIFPVGVLRQAIDRARRDGITGTDDGGLVRRLGIPVHLVPGSTRNIKLTHPEDLAILEDLIPEL